MIKCCEIFLQCVKIYSVVDIIKNGMANCWRNIILRCVHFVYLCEVVLLCLSKIPDGLIYNSMATSKAEARIGGVGRKRL